MSYRVRALIPGWWNELAPAEGRRISELLRELGARGGVAAALDPGGPGLCRGGMRFTPRAQRDFSEQMKEALFDSQVDAVVAVGEAASIDNLHLVAGWSPSTPRISLLRRENFSPAWAGQIPGACQLSDLVLLADPMGGRMPRDWVLARTAAEVCEEMGRRYLTGGQAKAPSRSSGQAGRSGGISILAVGRNKGGLQRLGRLGLPGQILPVPGGRGEVAAWNEAFRKARHPCVLSLDGDTALTAISLGRMREYLEGEAPLAAVGAVCGRPPRSGTIAHLAAAHALAGRGHRECAAYLDAFCWMLRRDAADLAGVLDDRFLSVRSAVLDYGLRMRQLGLRLVRATDVLAFTANPRRPASADLEADIELFRRKWCLGTTASLEVLCRKEPL